MASHAIFQYNVLAIDDTHNTWTNVIVKMTILRLLGSSDDKEKRGIARPEGPPYGGSACELTDVGQNELTGAITEKVCGLGFYTGLTDAKEITYVGALTDEDRGNSIHRLNRRLDIDERRSSCPES